MREARVENKLKAEIEVLFVRIDTMEKTASQLQDKVREYNRKRDISNTKSTFVQLSNVKKQIKRFNRLYQICSNMLDHVKEQAMMSSTSSVLQEFVSMHEDVVKECKLDTMVEQYRELFGVLVFLFIDNEFLSKIKITLTFRKKYVIPP